MSRQVLIFAVAGILVVLIVSDVIVYTLFGLAAAMVGILVVLIVAGAIAYRIAGPQSPPSPSTQITYQGQSWIVFRPELLEVSTNDARLTLVLTKAAPWAGSREGGLVYQQVTGNFRMTATVRARKNSDPRQPVSSLVSLGGLMARNPAGKDQGGTENYVHIVVGNTPSGIGIETKTTRNSSTQYIAVREPSSDAELSMCRSGSTFSLYKRPIGATSWTLAQSYIREDLPDTLQVGVNIYAVLPTDLQVTFDNLHIIPLEDV